MQEPYLSKREQQIMEVIYRLGRADVAAVIDGLGEHVGNSAARTHLRILETKGHLAHEVENGRFIYYSTRPRDIAAQSALSRLLSTFFGNSVEAVVATLISSKESELSADELERIRQMINDAKARNDSSAHGEE